MTALIREHLLRAQQRMKAQEDKHRSERQFAVGDWVLLKLQPYMQQSVQRRSNHKLGFKYFGPYQVLERIGEVSYRLDLPAASKIHPVVHVSLLKPASAPEDSGTVPLSLHCMTSGATAPKPAQLLQSRLVQFGGGTRKQYKIAWSGLPLSMATWEWSSILHELPAT